VELEELGELVAFATYKAELGGGAERSNGEASVLAWANAHGGIAVIDESAATSIGDATGITVHGSLWLVIRGFKSRVLDRATAEGIVDDLISTGMRLPVTSVSRCLSSGSASGRGIPAPSVRGTHSTPNSRVSAASTYVDAIACAAGR
jgi:hypothetical protein